MERDAESELTGRKNEISIHTLRMERDLHRVNVTAVFVQFQSTRSAWSVTRRGRTLCGGKFISIHTLRMERDGRAPRQSGLRQDISIHTLRMERDRR